MDRTVGVKIIQDSEELNEFFLFIILKLSNPFSQNN